MGFTESGFEPELCGFLRRVTLSPGLITTAPSSCQPGISEHWPFLDTTSMFGSSEMYLVEMRSYWIRKMWKCYSVMSDSATPWTVACQAGYSPWGFPGKNTGVGCHFLLWGNLPYPGIEPASPALTGGFFTSSATWEAHFIYLQCHIRRSHSTWDPWKTFWAGSFLTRKCLTASRQHS